MLFQFTRPDGPRLFFAVLPKTVIISIHATHTGRDMQRMIPKRLGLKFQFTRRLRAAISSITSLADLPSDISIHATPTGRDLTLQESIPCPVEFQFTRPIRAAIRSDQLHSRTCSFQFTRPLRAAIMERKISDTQKEFQFARPNGPRCVYHCGLNVLVSISIHATHTGRDIDIPEGDGIDRFQFTRPIRAAISIYKAPNSS